MAKPIKGSCLCGSVTYQVTGDIKRFQYCHCSRCRKTSGAAFAPLFFVSPDDFEWLEGETLIGRYEEPKAKYFANNFCSRCGSKLPWQTQPGTAVLVTAGTVDSDLAVKPEANVYCASAAQWYIDPSELPHHDTLPQR